MVLYILRALFVLLMAALGWFYLAHGGRESGASAYTLVMPSLIAAALLFIALDVLSPRRKLSILAGSFFGLIVGIAIAYALSFVVALMVDNYYRYYPAPPAAVFVTSPGAAPTQPQGPPAPGAAAQPSASAQPTEAERLNARRDSLISFLNMIVGVVSCYLSISFVLQTKDDFRFIIPYVEFSKQTKGARPILLDTSVLIDGRIADIVETGMIETQLVVPNFVVDELQAVADSADRMKRNRGRRGLDVLARLRKDAHTDVILYESPRHHQQDEAGVDQLLVQLARSLNARILTNDYNLNKVAQLTGVGVVNVNDLAAALRPVVIPGEKMRVQIVKPGEEAGQGVGYLDDGTMVVVEQARPHLSQEVEFVVTRALQTSAGRMIFGRLASESAPAHVDRPRQTAANPQSAPR